MKDEEEKNMERLEELIRSQSFQELSQEERNFILQELGSEELFAAMQNLSPLLEEIPGDGLNLEPRPATLHYLRQKFLEEKSVALAWWNVFTLKLPAYATALITTIACLITWWLVQQPTKISNKSASLIIDTVYLTSKPDTIFKERVVYRVVKSPSTPRLLKEAKVEDVTTEKNLQPVSVSMKDKEELEKLLVSGSR